MLRAFALTLAATAVAVAALAQGPVPSPDRVEEGVLKAANDFRADNHLKPLRPNAALAAEARAFAQYLARTGGFSHTADGRDPGERAQAAGYAYCALAENIAYESSSASFGEGRLVRLFMSGWEASPGHRRNLLDSSLAESGVGVASAAGPEQKYVAVHVFGLPITARYSFAIRNASQVTLGYRLGGEHRLLRPRETIVHTTCDAAELVFDGDGPGARRFPAEAGATYVLSQAPKGVQIEVLPEARP